MQKLKESAEGQVVGSNPSAQVRVTVTSIIKLICKYLLELEDILYDLLLHLVVIELNGIQRITHLFKPIYEALNSLALFGFTAIEKDNYYIIRLLVTTL